MPAPDDVIAEDRLAARPSGHHVSSAADGTASRSFRGANGGAEHYITVEAPASLGLKEQIKSIEERYAAAQRSLGLAPETAIFRRIFLSDVLNQAAMVRNSALVAESFDNPVAVSIVQQAPLSCAKIALLAYHVESQSAVKKRRLTAKHMIVEKSGLRHLWSTRLCADDNDVSISSPAQTRDVFNDLIGTLATQGGTLRDHCVRTWIYLKGVDVFYKGMVDSRRELFAQQGLNETTHYIASTGIEGACAHRFDVVAMDAYSILDLRPNQISYLNDFDRLCPTKDYNVTFERGTRVAYADRAHHFISGTASIDSAGSIVHPGDVLRQLDRALEQCRCAVALRCRRPRRHDASDRLSPRSHRLRPRRPLSRRPLLRFAHPHRPGRGLPAGMADRSRRHRGHGQ